jgi:7-carboxy-7-deazaguanine synthase
MLYPINEIFYSLQGEANYAGAPAVFIRFQGCAVGCPFCDTKHTWNLDPIQQVKPSLISNKSIENNGWALFSEAQLINAILAYPQCRHIVFTGGEPGLYNLQALSEKLEQSGYIIQIETSGTTELNISNNTWVTLSPKLDMPGNKPVLASVAKRANEIKMPIGKYQDIRKLNDFLQNYPINTKLIWLQPLSCKENPTKLCLEQALANNWRVSLQIHKFLNIR